MSNVYVAAALFTPMQMRVNARIAAIVKEVGMAPFLPSVMSAEIWQGRAPKDCEPWERQAVVQGNVEGMNRARIMIARVSGDTKEVDTGVAWEMGYFFALAKQELEEWGHDRSGIVAPETRILIAYLEPSDRHQSLNLMLAETVSAAVYGDAQLHMCLTAIGRVSEALGGSPEPTATREHEALAHVLSMWTPDKLIKHEHEREPIGTDEEDGEWTERSDKAAVKNNPTIGSAGHPTFGSDEVREWEIGRGK